MTKTKTTRPSRAEAWAPYAALGCRTSAEIRAEREGITVAEAQRYERQLAASALAAHNRRVAASERGYTGREDS